MNEQNTRENMQSVLTELLRLYDWRRQVGATITDDQARQYGREKKAAWEAARRVLAVSETEHTMSGAAQGAGASTSEVPPRSQCADDPGVPILGRDTTAHHFSPDKRVLLPCPFCGSHNVKATIVPNTQGNRRYMYCLGCFAEGPWSRLDANEIELWNRREALSARGDIERDAARYRYIRNTAPWKSAAVAVMSCDVGDDIAMLTHDGLDAIIDNAMTQYVGEKK